MGLAERIALHNAKYELCACGTRHNGAAWTPALGWYDHSAAAPVGTGRTLDALIPTPANVAAWDKDARAYASGATSRPLVQSPFTRSALRGTLPAKELGR